MDTLRNYVRDGQLFEDHGPERFGRIDAGEMGAALHAQRHHRSRQWGVHHPPLRVDSPEQRA
jgi:hypothetical protein